MSAADEVGSQRIDLGTDDLLLDLRDDGVAVATLNRPDTRNAFSGAMGSALAEVYRRADTDDAIRVVVLTGTPPAFCAGADFSSGSDVFERSDTPTEFSANPVHPTAWQIRKPVIAAVNGHAIGLGLTLTLHCDMRFMALDAKYGIVQVRRGVMPDAMSHWTLPRIAGMANAADILLTGRTFTGAEAQSLGVANRVLPNDEVLPAALEVAHDMAVNTAPVSVAVAKRLLWGSFGLDPGQVERAETELHLHIMGEPDAREGVNAFLERRDPEWTMTVNDNWPAAWPGPEDVL
ncbi:enoyl-CoA hydratase/isomerase family protein [Rhabdothermincola salaria]|uniref:enoyl-CoA hydratase/isomerase family protein n=1 Tax=Rhabdothermincola salaria TaxID=2903142 RepID=UPI001E2E62D0|nr:enoyl-CoA hydratase-related protein [Rhabdothermincola salaria]MCD9624687.1 enoyl-CoA hydratase-related protein [Rhabdothermincola salaria]